MIEEARKNKKNWRNIGCLGIIVAIILVIVAIPAGIYGYYKYQTSEGINEATKYISAYLEQKYHKKFHVFNGNYIWATSSYTFDASPADDPEFKFPAFINKAFNKGIGDMYVAARMGREAHKLLNSFVDIISKNNDYGAMYGASAKLEDKAEEDMIESDIRRNNLTPLQAATKYPRKVYLNTGISYCLDVTEQNKEQIFKGVYSLVEFLKQKGFGYIEISIGFYPSNVLGGKTIKEVYGNNLNKFKSAYINKLTYGIWFNSEEAKNIRNWKDIDNYFYKKVIAEKDKKYHYCLDESGRVWIKDTNSNNKNNQKDGGIK